MFTKHISAETALGLLTIITALQNSNGERFNSRQGLFSTFMAFRRFGVISDEEVEHHLEFMVGLSKRVGLGGEWRETVEEDLIAQVFPFAEGLDSLLFQGLNEPWEFEDFFWIITQELRAILDKPQNRATA